MTTHFHPRPSASAPQSPARPGSARPTIRAITPSPPQDLSGTRSESRAQSEKPRYASPEVIDQPLMQPRSEEIPQTRNRSIKSEEIGTTHEAARDHAELQRDTVVMARRSPVKRQCRGKAYGGKPSTSSTTQSSRCRTTADDQTDKAEDGRGAIKQAEPEKVLGFHNKELSIDCPDTPTPMTLSQKRSAYLPLVSPTPVIHTQCSMNARSSPDVIVTSARSAASQEPSLSPRASITNIKNPMADYTTQQKNVLAEHQNTRSYVILANNTDEKNKPTALQPHAKTYHHQPFNSNSQSTAPKANAIQPAPLQTRDRTAPRKPISSSPTKAQHHSSSLSEASNHSGGTAQSQRSVFSTPGRDELERKKAMVEADDGPFGRVVSVAQLNEARKVVSGGARSKQSTKGDYDDYYGYGEKGGKREGICGRCSVM